MKQKHNALSFRNQDQLSSNMYVQSLKLSKPMMQILDMTLEMMMMHRQLLEWYQASWWSHVVVTIDKSMNLMKKGAKFESKLDLAGVGTQFLR